jgi:predicted nuclease of predicted toxin-antitoxin system
VKLLLDQNLAPRLVTLLADLFPGSTHVRDVGLAAATDADVWSYAKAGGYAIVSKDGDFRQLSFRFGAPPKVVWLRIGNASTTEIHALMRAHAADFAALDADTEAALLIVSPSSGAP